MAITVNGIYLDVFRNQTTNAITDIFRFDSDPDTKVYNTLKQGILIINGTLDGAILTLQIQDQNPAYSTNWISTSDNLTSPMVQYFASRAGNYRIQLSNAGADTNITVQLIYGN